MSSRSCIFAAAIVLGTATCLAQNSGSRSAPAADVPTKTAAELQGRMSAALNAENNHDYETAYKLYKDLIAESPLNRELLMQSAIAARGAGHPEEALALYQQGIKLGEPSNKHEAMVVIPIYAALHRWEDFDKARATLRSAALADSTIFSGRGYLIEEFTSGARQYRVIEYPTLHGHFNTRYRFLVVSESTPDFTPYYDLESDDADQAFAKKGERVFSLDSYPKPGAQALMGFFTGEPSYETIRATVAGKTDVKPAAATAPAPTKPVPPK